MSATAVNCRIELLPDDDPDTSWLTQDGFEDMRAQYEAGDFGFVGLRLACELRIPDGAGWIVQHISTPGLWGIEDWAGEAYFEEVACDEYHTLNAMLNELGVPTPVYVQLTHWTSR